MTAYNPAEVERLIAEAREDDARMEDAPWSTTVGNGSDRISRTTVSNRHGSVASTDYRPLEHRLDCLNAAAIARTRNNLAALADQLEAARAEIGRLRARPAPNLAERCHKVQGLTSRMESDLVHAVEAACGKRVTGDDEDLRTDGYDNSLEVWGVLDIDLDAAARKLKESGFAKVWLHQHMDRENCKCPSR